MTGRRIFVLLGRDRGTGLAVRPAGVLGFEPEGFHVSFVPYEPAAEAWRDRVLTASAPVAEAVDRWLEFADGVTFDLLEVSGPSPSDLRTAVESVMDELLASLPVE